ncbi:MAG: ATP-dependent Clp protease ATP-binding subunit [Frisingicoccus sp.]|uniref:ATP-dependent Clp protease ATP-binding subunit n=1 Tax=Frisingicoccus sp. TaxID=1918627 RepID=UPI002A83F647|nr:ATP-dependent Clp protease ATP-binding subunit [Frisingicoccus sp.]MDY4833685.1 ATP-dependent Clp protease ATP-binding subunit [Frisingicoccus sp.]
MQYRLTRQAQKAVEFARDIAEELQHNYIGTEHLLLGLIRAEEGLASKVLRQNDITEEQILNLIEQLINDSDVMEGEVADYTPRAKRVLECSSREASRLNQTSIGTEHLLIALLREKDCIALRLLNTLGVSIPKIYSELFASMGMDVARAKEYLESQKETERDSALESYAMDLTALAAEGKLDPVIGRNEEIQRVIQILSRRTKNNPCLIGEPGVGKTAVVEGLAARIAEGDVPDSIRDKRVMTLDLSGMVAGSKYRGEFEERIKRLIAEVKRDGQVLLFIDEIHTIIGAGGAEGALDASNILKPSLARGEIQVIGATTIEEYRKYIEKDAALERRFQPVMTNEPSEAEAIAILEGLRSAYENHHQVTITDEAIETAVKMSIRYINDRFLPDKAIDLIDEASAKVKLSSMTITGELQELVKENERLEEEKEKAIIRGDMIKASDIGKDQKLLSAKILTLKKSIERKNKRRVAVSARDVADVVSSWTKIPVKQLEEKESERLMRLESTLHRRVIGQDEAVTAVAKAIRRGRVGLKDPKRPIGSFLFLGPTGVGKTELSKALAEAMFGSDSTIIRVDMSEYMEKHSVSKLIGSPPGYVGYDEGGQLSERVRRNPYSILLFDEIEKAHPDVFNVLLQVLDDGHITDSQGRKVDFKNTVIIMTSNAGASNIVTPKKLGFFSETDEKADYDRMKSAVMEEVKHIFKPEFLNRIDDIIVFHSLTKEHIQKIVAIMMNEISDRALDQMGIHLHTSEGVLRLLAEAGFDPVYGARPLRRAIQNKVEDLLAEEILSGRIRRGDQVRLTLAGKEIKISIN